MTTVREYREAIEREIRQWPEAKIEFLMTRKHQKLAVRFRRKTAKRIFATSASDWRGMQNTVSDLRRALRSFGAVRTKTANDN